MEKSQAAFCYNVFNARYSVDGATHNCQKYNNVNLSLTGANLLLTGAKSDGVNKHPDTENDENLNYVNNADIDNTQSEKNDTDNEIVHNARTSYARTSSCQNINNIPVIIGNRPTTHDTCIYNTNASNLNNLVTVHDMEWNFPRFVNANARSIGNKMNELEVIAKDYDLDMICITETWLTNENDSIQLNGYHPPFRTDRENRRGGGAMCLVKDNIKVKHWSDLNDNSIESTWLTLYPKRLPRAISSLTVGVIYHPPNADNFHTYTHISTSLDQILQKHPETGIILVGDFNSFKDSYLKQNYTLRQIVEKPTRENRILDKVYTNVDQFYDNPQLIAPLGASDHSVVLCNPQTRSTYKKPETIVIKRRSNDQNSKNMFVYALKQVSWNDVYDAADCESKFKVFHDTIQGLLDYYLPIVETKSNTNDKPWLTDSFRNKIYLRQKAWHEGNQAEFNKLRNNVNHSSRYLKSKFYRNSVEDLKQTNPSQWWRKTKVLAGIKGKDSLSGLISMYHGDTIQLANDINCSFQSITNSLQPLDLSTLPPPISEVPSEYIISMCQIENELSKIQINKSTGPDDIPNWVLRDLAPVLAPPLASVFNASIREGFLPQIWKSANITPIPKVSMPQDITTDLRPISLTSVTMKVLESFVATWIWNSVKGNIHNNQFGGIKNSSTTHALVSMLHTWHSAVHDNKSVRILLLDYKKAFDLVDHTILISKLKTLEVHDILLRWIGAFLSDRQIRVRINKDVSEWLHINASVPQGSKLGPLLFVIMINDLQISVENTNLYKYMDDSTVDEIICDPSDSKMQAVLNEVNVWSVNNNAQLNLSKTVEMIISFKKDCFDPPSLHLNGNELHRVKITKLLGLVISNDLSWSEHVSNICKKASKRLYFLILLRRSGLCKDDLLTYYKHIIRPVLEYCCVVWHSSITKGQSEQIENIQIRALNIIGLKADIIESLSDRREKQCTNFFTEMFNDKSHKLHELLPEPKAQHYMNTRHFIPMPLPRIMTERFKNSFINYSLFHRQVSLKS